jgi:hypothetical protein
MDRTTAFAVVMTSVVTFFGPQAEAQQANLPGAQAISRQTQDAAMAAAAGPEFQRTGFATVGKPTPRVKRPQTSGPFPPQPYQRPAQAQPQPPSDYATPQYQSDPGAYSPQLEARSHKIFGWGNVSTEPQRQQWMADQEQRAIENEINRTKALVYPVGAR